MIIIILIQLADRCANVIGKKANLDSKHVWLPSDICPSVIESFKKYNVNFSFYPVLRKWTSDDIYSLENINSDDIVLVSDLFNFRTINLKQLQGFKIYLDLAHCSLETAKWYLKKISSVNIQILNIFISFGKGKYYRFGGGGVGFTPNEINSLTIANPPQYSLLGIPDYLLNNSLYNESSTRVILPSQYIEKSKIQLMREKGIDISDSFFDHLLKRTANEYVIWKTSS